MTSRGSSPDFMQERLFLFRELICKDVDWTGLGMPAYSCFNAFFTRIWNEASNLTNSTSRTSASSTASTAAGARVNTISTNNHSRASTATVGAENVTTGLKTSPLGAPLPQPPMTTTMIASSLSESGASEDKGSGSGTSPIPPVPPGGEAASTSAATSASTDSTVVEEEDLTELGIDTLWRVTLTSQNAEVAASATQDLLAVSHPYVVLKPIRSYSENLYHDFWRDNCVIETWA